MHWVNVSENSISVSGKSVLVVGNANANSVIFSFSSEWDGLVRVAVFKNSINTVLVEVPPNNRVVIPWECCEEIGDTVYVGCYGLDEDGNIRRPTQWVGLGKIVDGVVLDGVVHADPSKSVFVELLDKIESLENNMDDASSSTGSLSTAVENLESMTASFRQKIDDVEDSVETYSHHENLKGRDLPNQHPISAVTNLAETIAAGDDALTVDELHELLGGDD